MRKLRALARWIKRKDEDFKIIFRDLIESTVFILIATFVVLLISIFFLWKFSYSILLQSPGTIFVIIVGFATILGFYFTWKSIKSSYYISQFTVFSDLLRRIEEIVVETIRKKTGAPLKIICFTPAIGNLSDYGDFRKVKAILYELMKEPQKIEIEIICLKDPKDTNYEDILNNLNIKVGILKGKLEELEAKLKHKEAKKLLQGHISEYISESSNYEKKQKELNELLENDEAKKYFLECFNESETGLKYQIKYLIHKLKEQSPLFEFYLSYGVIYKEKHGIIGKERSFLESYFEARELIKDLKIHGAQFYMVGEDSLPDFHLILNSKRAIAYVPLSYYPYLFKQDRWWPKIKLNWEEICDLTKNQKTCVEIFGFETTEKNLLSQYEEYFEFCRRFLI
jgi:hypothetical protein